MNELQDVTIAGKGEKASSTKSSELITKLNDDLTKGGFVDILKDIGDYEMSNSFLEAQ